MSPNVSQKVTEAIARVRDSENWRNLRAKLSKIDRSHDDQLTSVQLGRTVSSGKSHYKAIG